MISTINNTWVLALKEIAVYWELHLIQRIEIKEMTQIERNAAFSRHKQVKCLLFKTSKSEARLNFV